MERPKEYRNKMATQMEHPAIAPRRLEIVRTVTYWIKLAALSLLISTAIIGSAGFALWWWFTR